MEKKVIDGKKFEFDNGFVPEPKKFLGISLFQLGELCCEAGFEIYPHKQWCHEISYVVSGSGHFFCNDTPIKVCEGDIIINPLNHYHAIKADNNEHLRFACIGFEFNDASNIIEYDILKKFYSTTTNFHAKGKADVMLAFVRSLGELYHVSECDTLMINSYINQILILVYRVFSSAQESKYILNQSENSVGQTVYSVIRYIENNIFNLKSIQEVSKEIGYDYCYLSRIFKSKVGTTLQQYINEKKMEKAVELFKYCNLNATQVSERLHYTNVQSFSRAFKRTTGIYPTEFLENLKGS